MTRKSLRDAFFYTAKLELGFARGEKRQMQAILRSDSLSRDGEYGVHAQRFAFHLMRSRQFRRRANNPVEYAGVAE